MIRHSTRAIRLAALLLATAVAALLLSACGSGSGSSGTARTLLRQTFSGAHKVNSGQLSFSLAVSPSGSSTLTKPITLSLSGPFQSLGQGKLPESNFTVAISAQGHTGALSILSTGTKGYVTMSGTSYQLPASSFQKLESSFSSIASSGSGGSHGKSGVLAKLGINPLGWLRNPQVVGSGSVAGAQATHIRASVNVAALLRDVSRFVQKAASLGVSGTSSLSGGLSAATQQRVAGEIHNPSFDLWTGTGDKTLRRLQVGLTVPLSGSLSTLLGKSAGISLSLQYSNLNQPQTITAPSKVEAYSLFSAKLTSLLRSIAGGVTSGTLGGTGSSGTGGTSTGSTGSSSTGGSGASGATTAYSQCLQKAGQDIAKMQQCASKLNSSSGG